MITTHQGDLLVSGCDIIAHQVNEYGAMGAGIAAQIRKTYPEAFDKYFELCKKAKGYGQVQFCECGKTVVANCFSQKDWNTDYELLHLCAGQLYKYALDLSEKENRHITVGIPYNYGCGIATGDWDKVYEIFEKFFNKNGDIELQIWGLVTGETNNEDNKLCRPV